jgi:hypothetical protein
MNDSDTSQSFEVPSEKQAEKHLDWHFYGKPVCILFLCVNNSARSQQVIAIFLTLCCATLINRNV